MKILDFPDKFVEYLIEAAGDETACRVMEAIAESTPETAVRINDLKVDDPFSLGLKIESKIPWCNNGYYLKERADFTFDPLFHAGGYYVQEPSSMFLAVLEPIFREMKPRSFLDLCAAPGGKSTHLVSMVARSIVGSENLSSFNSMCSVVCNEVIGSRASVLAENIAKWGVPGVMVTSHDPRYFSKGGWLFDFILVDAPCSGEGMFRKDPKVISEWSESGVNLCAARQRRILSDIWGALAPGGLLAYSTCTFNRRENDDNVRWLKSEFGALSYDLGLTEDVIERWGIFVTQEGGYQFFPGLARGEGFYFALVQKPLDKVAAKHFAPFSRLSSVTSTMPTFLKPSHEYALSICYGNEWPSIELSRQEALNYLSRNSVKLKENAPLGYLRVTFMGLGLGFVKNLGNRVNNLYPVNRRILYPPKSS